MSVLSRTSPIINSFSDSFNDTLYQNSSFNAVNQNNNNQSQQNELPSNEFPRNENTEQKNRNNGNQNEIGDKFNRLWDLGVWIIAFLISMALCLPGIIISIQYSTDACVRKSGAINLALDGWLFIACMFVFIYMIIWLLFICTRVADRVFKCYWIVIHCLQIAWYSIGIYLIVNSTMECEHNSLWEMAVAYCALMGTAWVIETVMMILKWCCNNSFNSSNCCSCNDELRNETYYIMSHFSQSPSLQQQLSNNQLSNNQLLNNQLLNNQGSLMEDVSEDSLLSEYHINDNDCIVDNN